MPETKHKVMQTSSVQKSFDQGARSGEQFGMKAAPFILLAALCIAGWVAFRIARWFLRSTR